VWTFFECPSLFVASGTTTQLTITQTPGGVVNTFDRFFDDISLFDAGPDAAIVPFYRLYGEDHDLPFWGIPTGTTAPTLQPDRAITGVTATELRDGGLEIGVRNIVNARVNLDQIELDLTIQSLRERHAFVSRPVR
jgi:hypothetical protein